MSYLREFKGRFNSESRSATSIIHSMIEDNWFNEEEVENLDLIVKNNESRLTEFVGYLKQLDNQDSQDNQSNEQWIDPAGGIHYGHEENPASMYE